MKTEPITEPADPRAVATAAALGELTAEERASFEKECAENPELESLAGGTKEFCDLLTGALAQPTPELQQAARARLLFEADKRIRSANIIRHKWMRRVTAAAACVAVGGGATYVYLASTNSLDRTSAAAPEALQRAHSQLVSLDTRKVGGKDSLDAEIVKQELAVERARVAMLDVMKKHDIVDYVPLSSGNGAASGIPAETSETGAAGDVAVAKYSYENQLQRLNGMREHAMKQVVDQGVPGVPASPPVSGPAPVTATPPPATAAPAKPAAAIVSNGTGILVTDGEITATGTTPSSSLASNSDSYRMTVVDGRGLRERGITLGTTDVSGPVAEVGVRTKVVLTREKSMGDFDQGIGGLYFVDGTDTAAKRPKDSGDARYTFVGQPGIDDLQREKASESVLEQEVSKMTRQMEGLRSLKGEQLIRGAMELGVQNATIQKVYPEYQTDVAALSLLEKEGYGPDHPKIRGLRESIRLKFAQLESAADTYKDSLEIQIENSRKMLVDARRRTADQSTPGTESYKPLPENPFFPVLRAPLSTFSIDVDTASYSNVRRFLNMGQCPPPEAVRLEELVNYFPYDYAQPVDGKPFAVHVEMTSAPWNASHRVARIALKGKEIAQTERPAANLVFLVDVSGSMDQPNKLPLVKQSLKFVVERLSEKDTVSLVTYAGESGVALPVTNGAEKKRILAAIDGLGAGGSTNGAGGIGTAYAQAATHFNKEGINRVILATDGDFNVGVTSHEELLTLITEKAKTGVFLSVLGYGMGNTKDDTMELLADKGNGNYAYIDSLSEARKSLADQFTGTLVTIAKDVKIQIEFNPNVVRSYRLLGYENRMLAKEDFNNDKKDAGEIGAGHTVTALYELVPVGAPEEQVVTPVDGLKYQPKTEPVPAPPPAAPPAEVNGETMTVKLRWKAPDADVSQLMEVPVKDSGAKITEASPETRWAVAVAGFAALLNNSQYNGLTWEDVRALAKSSKGADPNGYRGEFLQLLNKAESVRR